MKNKFLLPLLLISYAHAMIVTNPAFAVVSPNSKTLTYVVENKSDAKAYGKVVFRASRCQTPEESSAVMIESRCSFNISKDDEEKLIKQFKASANKLVLKPNQKKTIKIFWQGDLPKTDLYFNFGFEDMSQKVQKRIKKLNENMSFQLNIKTMQMVTLLVTPKNFANELPKLTQDNNGYTISNSSQSKETQCVYAINKCVDGKCSHINSAFSLAGGASHNFGSEDDIVSIRCLSGDPRKGYNYKGINIT